VENRDVFPEAFVTFVLLFLPLHLGEG
jgi:hypothetical protein